MQSISEELATHRALVFKRVVDLLGVGRDRLELREYLAERRWAEVEDPTAQEATARELILSTPGMEGFIKSQVEIEALWIGLIVADDFAEGRTRKLKNKAD